VIALKDPAIHFTRRPVPIPGDLRTVWRGALVLLALNTFRDRHGTPLRRLHVVLWGCSSNETRRTILEAVGGARLLEECVRIDPLVNRTVDLLIGLEYATRVGGRIRLTSTGKIAAAEIAQSGALDRENATLKELSAHGTRRRVDALLGGRE
jgi:hypothetical protein